MSEARVVQLLERNLFIFVSPPPFFVDVAVARRHQHPTGEEMVQVLDQPPVTDRRKCVLNTKYAKRKRKKQHCRCISELFAQRKRFLVLLNAQKKTKQKNRDSSHCALRMRVSAAVADRDLADRKFQTNDFLSLE